MIDPSAAPVRASPREDRDLFIAAANGHVLAFDNLSILPPWLSDTLCWLASGGAFAVRQLYTDRDEVLFTAARPIMLNGIEDSITRPDLGDRAIFITLSSIDDQQRRPEQILWQNFELARPQILGALLDAVVQGLQGPRDGRVMRLPRMADFARWVAACEAAYCTPGTFESAYRANRQMAVENVIDADPVALCVRHLMSQRTAWAGAASEFSRLSTEVLSEILPGQSNSIPGWPKSPRALSGRLRRAQTFLRVLGIEMTFKRDGRTGTRLIRISRS